MDRLINEQDVLDVINEAIRIGRFYCGKEQTIDEIKAIPSAEPSRDMKEIEEVINCDADAETKCKMISNILTAKPHYFAKQELKYCDRNICLKNEYNGIGCDECEVTKSKESCEDAISRQAVLDYIHRILNQGTGKKKSFEFIRKYVEKLPPVKPQEKTGHWIFHEIEDTLRWYECDQCGAEAVKEYDYCHGCGAKMVKEQKRVNE